MQKIHARRIDILVTIFITFVIWNVANEATITKENVFTELKFTAPNGYIVLGKSSNEVKLEISGSARAVNRARKILEKPVNIKLSAEKNTTVQNINTLKEIQTLLNSSGVSLTSASPDTIEKNIDVLIEANLPLSLRLPGAQIDGPPIIQPENILIEIPQSLKRIIGNQPASLLIPDEITSKLTTGVVLTREVEIELPSPINENKNIRILNPKSKKASLTFKLKSKIDWKPIRKVNIWATSPASDFDKFKITFDPPIVTDLLAKLTDEEHANILSNQSRLIATLPISTNEKEKGSTKKNISGFILITKNGLMRTVAAKQEDDQKIEEISIIIEPIENIAKNSE